MEPNDISDWARRLHDRLEQLGVDYIATPWTAADDPEACSGLNFKQMRAGEIVAEVASALRELPNFGKSKGTAALHDIASAMSDVVGGKSPRLFRPVPTGGPGGDGIDRNYVKVHVVWAVRFMMEAHGWSEKKAKALVARKFADAGAKGRKGNSLSPTTVHDWCARATATASGADDARIHREVELRMQKLRSDSRWPGNVEDSIAWIDKIASDPLLTSKYG